MTLDLYKDVSINGALVPLIPSLVGKKAQLTVEQQVGPSHIRTRLFSSSIT
jgi:hypothetical protein